MNVVRFEVDNTTCLSVSFYPVSVNVNPVTVQLEIICVSTCMFFGGCTDLLSWASINIKGQTEPIHFD